MNRYHQRRLNRRHFLKSLGLIPLLPYVSACQLAQPYSDVEYDFAEVSPVNRSASSQQTLFSGDDFSRPHAVLWNKSAYITGLGDVVKPTRKTEVLIVGGGMSGLLSAYLLRDKKPLLLEQASRFGGNAKAEAWDGLPYALGAAYLAKPKLDSKLYGLFKELGIADDWTIKNSAEGRVVISGSAVQDFWHGAHDPANQSIYKNVYDYLQSFDQADRRMFPEYPTEDQHMRTYLNQLDTESFKAHLQRVVGSELPLPMQTLLEHYCFSSFGGSAGEISAAAGINFYAGELSQVAVFPGGNAYIAETLLKQLYRDLPSGHLLPGCLVFDVSPQSDGILVSYQDANLQVQRILAERVVMACPKFVCAKLIDTLSAEKRAAIARLQYRAYLVANLRLKRRIAETDYDVFWLGDGKTDLQDTLTYAKSRGITDIINANFAAPDPRKTVLSFYQALPYAGGRNELYQADAYRLFKDHVAKQLKAEIFPFYGLTDTDVVDLRLTRWGHPLPLAATGLLNEGVVDILRAPVDDRIYFIEQDNWALPAIEAVFAEADYWCGVLHG